MPHCNSEAGARPGLAVVPPLARGRLARQGADAEKGAGTAGVAQRLNARHTSFNFRRWMLNQACSQLETYVRLPGRSRRPVSWEPLTFGAS